MIDSVFFQALKRFYRLIIRPFTTNSVMSCPVTVNTYHYSIVLLKNINILGYKNAIRAQSYVTLKFPD